MHVHGCHLSFRVEGAKSFSVASKRTERNTHVPAKSEGAGGHERFLRGASDLILCPVGWVRGRHGAVRGAWHSH